MRNKKLRIAIVISHPIQHFCPQYVSFAENKDVEIKVFFASTLGFKKYMDANFQQEISWGNLHLDQFDHTFLNGDVSLQADRNLDAPSLNTELDNYKPDLLFNYGYFQKLQRRARKWAIKNKVPIAFIADSELRHPRSRFKEFFKSIYLKQYFSKIDYFLTVGNANEEFYRKYKVPEDKFLRMHYPIDLKEYQQGYLQKKEHRKTIRSKYKIGDDEIVLTVVGKLVEWKSQDHIIEALQLLEQENVKINLFILGSGEMRKTWELKAKELQHHKVFFQGFVNIEELPAYYAATDIYVHPASMEPHSVAISEAIIMGTPIILSSRCGSYGTEDDVQVDKNGFVYDFGNKDELAKAILKLSKDKKMRLEFSDFSHRIGSQFQETSHYQIIKKVLNLYAK